MKNLRYALRILNHYRFYSVINILGLALSLACTIVLVKYVFRESTVNHFITDLDKVYYMAMDDGRHPTCMYGGSVVSVNGQNVDLAVQPGVESVAEVICGTTSITIDGQDEPVEDVEVLVADSSICRVIDFPLSHGEWPADSSVGWIYQGVMVNESAARLLGVGAGDMIEYERSEWPTSSSMPQDDRRRRVVGVMRDFQPQHLSASTPPIIIAPKRDALEVRRLFVRPAAGRTAEAIEALERIYKYVSPTGYGFSYSLLDDEIRARYADESRTGRVYTTFALIAMFISSMGLLGLSLYDVRQRYREIALRCINGATVGLVVDLLLRRYYLLLVLAFVIAAPLAAWGISLYMTDFATKAPMSWWTFAVAALLTAVVSLLSLYIQSRRAATRNPIEALKTN